MFAINLFTPWRTKEVSKSEREIEAEKNWEGMQEFPELAQVTRRTADVFNTETNRIEFAGLYIPCRTWVGNYKGPNTVSKILYVRPFVKFQGK